MEEANTTGSGDSGVMNGTGKTGGGGGRGRERGKQLRTSYTSKFLDW